MRVTVNIHHSVGKCKLKPQWDNNYKLTRMISISKTNKKKQQKNPNRSYWILWRRWFSWNCHKLPLRRQMTQPLWGVVWPLVVYTLALTVGFSVRSSVMFPQKEHLSPNPQYVIMWPYLDIGHCKCSLRQLHIRVGNS